MFLVLCQGRAGEDEPALRDSGQGRLVKSTQFFFKQDPEIH